MKVLDNNGGVLLPYAIGKASFGAYQSNLVLTGTQVSAALEFRSGSQATNPFAQMIGGAPGSTMAFDCLGGAWRWRSVLNDDNSTRMLLDSTGLAVTGKVVSNGTVLEPFSSTQPSTNGVQIALGNTLRSFFGARYSGGNTFVAHNARQTNSSTDQWQQTYQTSWDSIGIFLSGSTGGGGGLQLKRAASGTAANTFASFWTDIFQISLSGAVTTGTWNATPIGLQYGGTGANMSSYAQHSFVFVDQSGGMSAVAPNTQNVRKFMSMTGTGSAGAAATWETIPEVPIGTIVAWHKNCSSNVPTYDSSRWLECNGGGTTIINGATAPIPDLNGSQSNGSDKFFLRGIDISGGATTGGTGGTYEHSHTSFTTTSQSVSSGGGANAIVGISNTQVKDHIPPYFEIVWIMRKA